MLGHFRLRLGNLDHLAPFPTDLRCRFQAGTAPSAGGRPMFKEVLRISHQATGYAGMTSLPAALLAAALAQAARVGPLGRPIAGGRLVAVMAVLVQAGFQFRQTRCQPLHLLFELSLLCQQVRQLTCMSEEQLLDPGDHRIRPGLIDRQDFVP
jgi:hypothetical protein